MKDWRIPWKPLEDPAHGVTELAREVPRGHVMWGVPVKAIAYRQDCDDVLFELLDGSNRVAVVHLSFQVEHDPRWPETQLFAGIGEFAQTRMCSDAEDFGA